MVTYIVFIVAVALTFDFINGFHDSANSIATIVGTRVLSPLAAVAMAAFFNFAAAFVVGTAVAKTVGSGMIDVSIVTPNVILGGLTGAIVWNLITWWFGLPSSSSHALLGGYAGAALAKAGWVAIIPGGWTKTVVMMVLSPLIGMSAGYLLMVAFYWMFRNSSPHRVDSVFRRAQLVSSALFSLSHGANDAQKTMGIIVGLLVSAKGVFIAESGILRNLHLETAEHVPFWIVIAAHLAIALGTLFGGWRIVKTMGSRITKLRPIGGAAAETGGAMAIFGATALGIPVSTTHTITGAIVGVGATHRLSAVRWGLAGRVVWAWILTIPAAALTSAIVLMVLEFVSAG